LTGANSEPQTTFILVFLSFTLKKKRHTVLVKTLVCSILSSFENPFKKTKIVKSQMSMADKRRGLVG
jgi:hypothetical protein